MPIQRISQRKLSDHPFVRMPVEMLMALHARNVSGAQRELLKYYASVTSNRWLMLKIFGVLIIFVRSRQPG